MYDIFMMVLAVISVLIAFLDLLGKFPPLPWIGIVEAVIWGIFVVDYAVRFVHAKDKKTFFRQNIFDFVSILPFNAFLRVFRITRLLRLTKLARITKAIKLFKLISFFGRLSDKISRLLKTNGLVYVLGINACVVFLGALGIYLLENGTTVNSFADALWWSVVTATTVGYGDISPATGAGRIIAVILMLAGIGTIGMLTSTLSTFFLTKRDDVQLNSNDDLHAEIDRLPPSQIEAIRQIVLNFKK